MYWCSNVGYVPHSDVLHVSVQRLITHATHPMHNVYYIFKNCMTGWYGPAQYSSMLKIHIYENLNNVCLF